MRGVVLLALCAVQGACAFVTVPGARSMNADELDAQLVTVGAWSVRIGGVLPQACVSRLERTKVAASGCAVFTAACGAGCLDHAACLTFDDTEGGHDVIVINVDHRRYEPGYWHGTAIVHETIHQLAGCTHPYHWQDPYHDDPRLWTGTESVQDTAKGAL